MIHRSTHPKQWEILNEEEHNPTNIIIINHVNEELSLGSRLVDAINKTSADIGLRRDLVSYIYTSNLIKDHQQ